MNKNKNTGVYIPSIDAKDIYLALHYVNQELSKDGYSLKLRNGEYNLKKFINTLDYSLDLIELIDIYRHKFGTSNFAFKVKNHMYSTNVINLTFKYSVKQWNQMNKHTYVKFGYEYRSLEFKDSIARNERGEIVGIKLNEKIESSANDLPKYFTIQYINDSHKVYCKAKKDFKTIKTNSELRKELYTHGFICDGQEYIRMKRSSGSARVGKCLFIKKDLYRGILNFCSKGIKIRQGQVVDLAAYESYISLTSSSIIDVLPIVPENILIIDDYESVFKEDVIATYDENGWLKTQEQNCEISNSIWDGQSLMDISLFGKYEQYGMVLLRNLMFKSCCFNCNIQQWFKDHNITDVSQLNGYTRATKIEDVKLITTPNSIKYLKFSTLDNWLDNLYPNFGVVKHDKKTHFFEGQLVQTHYQLLNTLQMSRQEVSDLLQDSLKFIQALKCQPEVVRYFIKYPDIDDFSLMSKVMTAKSDVVYNLMSINNQFQETKYYHEFINDLVKAFYKNLKCGHVYVNGNYSTLLGNPIEMLQQSIGMFNGESQLGIGNVHSTRFDYNKTILASRSPHVTIGNIWLPYNTENEMIDKYLNLTNEIICINSIGENVLQRLSGADFDSDTVMITDNEILITAAQKNYHIFKTPTSFVSAKKVKRYYTADEQADLDIKTSINKIGEIINLSQELNSLLWDKIYKGQSYDDEEIKNLYYDICQLDVMSGIEIDKAKKEFDIDNTKELNKIRDKYKEQLLFEENGRNKKIIPHFFSHIARQKGYYDPVKKEYTKYNTTMDYLQTVVNGFKVKHPYRKTFLPFSTVLNKSNYRPSMINHEKINQIFSLIQGYVNNRTYIELLTNISHEEKYTRIQKIYDELIYTTNDISLNFSTVYELMHTVENENIERSIRNLILQILFFSKNESFKKAIIESKEYIPEIQTVKNNNVLDDDSQLLTFYGIDFIKKDKIIYAENNEYYKNEW